MSGDGGSVDGFLILNLSANCLLSVLTLPQTVRERKRERKRTRSVTRIRFQSFRVSVSVSVSTLLLSRSHSRSRSVSVCGEKVRDAASGTH